MIFKLFKSGKAAEPGPAAEDKPSDESKPTPTSDGEAVITASAGSTGTLLPASELRRAVDPKKLGFKTTAELEPGSGLVGQERALRAIQFGADMRAPDFNMFVLGLPASGKSTAVRMHLAAKAAAAPTPDDWVYVNNFSDANRPRALRLPAGVARQFAKAMVEAIDELRATLPATFESEEYQVRRRAIEEETRAGHEEALEAFNRKAQAQNIAVLRTPMGIAMAPMHEGKVVKPDVFAKLPEAMQKDVEGRIEALQQELAEILSNAPKVEKIRRNRLSELNAEFARTAIRAALDEVRVACPNLPQVDAHIEAAETDLVRNVGLFLTAGEEGEVVKAPVDTSRDPRFRRYMVNVVVAKENGDEGAPIVEELNPTHGNIIGRAEHVAQMGTLLTDFLLLKAGALHRANGGYLLVDARKLLLSPFAWEALKRTLKAGEIRIEQPGDALGLISSQSIDPEPVPLSVKVVLFGERELYYLLAEHDPDFTRLFKVQADFDDDIARDNENEAAFARLVASVVREHNLKPVDAGGVARIIDEAARMASDREKLSVEIGRIADIIREADYWAAQAGRDVTMREDMARAIDEQIQRADRVRDRTQEVIGRGFVLVDTDGEKVGQINGLSVIQLAGFAFGRPSRITARVRMGQGRVTDIEREVKLGGPLHSKGVMILWGYLAGHFAQDFPLALAATLVFEQSYGGVDGDSASSAELYALLSALADAPITQGYAVTGSVNQRGEVQAIGGVNEKIEGFFDVCKARGLTGRQGVLIPKSNVQNLMLREDIVEAVAAGKFAIHAVSTIDQGIALLTGREADTVKSQVEAKLRSFAERAKAFSSDKGEREGMVGKGAQS